MNIHNTYGLHSKPFSSSPIYTKYTLKPNSSLCLSLYVPKPFNLLQLTSTMVSLFIYALTFFFPASDDVCNVSDDFDWIGSELSAPQDPVECVTDFFDGFISTNELSFLEDFGDFLGKSEEEIKTTPSRDFKFGMTKKKPRSKRRLKQRAWPMKDFVFSALQNHEFRKRICTHCQIDKTPQWRIGPLGPKTLCNACGVRYNTGRLLPEYRPAASPSFDQNKHSNLHKQILRRRANLI